MAKSRPDKNVGLMVREQMILNRTLIIPNGQNIPIEEAN